MTPMLPPYDRWEIEHLSPSSLNLWIDEPALWSLKYLRKFRDTSGPAASRGSAVERGLDALLVNAATMEQAVKIAHEHFDREIAGELSDDIDKERASLEPMLGQAAQALFGFPEQPRRQNRVMTFYQDVYAPVLGYVDYVFPTCFVDLKTTHRVPSTPPANHLRQVAMYNRELQLPPKLIYVSTKKFFVYTPTEEELTVASEEMRRAGLTLQRALDRAKSVEEFEAHLFPRLDSFYYSNPETKQLAIEVYYHALSKR